MKKYFYLFISAGALLSSSELQAVKTKLGFMPQGSIYKITANKDFISGSGQLFDLSGQPIEKWNVISGHPFDDLLIHPDEMSLVAIDASGHLVRLDRQKFCQPHYEGQVLFTTSCVSYLNLLTYTPNGKHLFVAQIYPEGRYLTNKEIKQNLEILENNQIHYTDILQKRIALFKQQSNLQHEKNLKEINAVCTPIYEQEIFDQSKIDSTLKEFKNEYEKK